MSLVIALASATIAVGLESLYRINPAPWRHFLPVALPASLFISWSLCYLVRSQGSLLDALVLWSLCTVVMRVGAQMLIGDPIPPGLWCAVGLMVVARLVAVVWR